MKYICKINRMPIKKLLTIWFIIFCIVLSFLSILILYLDTTWQTFITNKLTSFCSSPLQLRSSNYFFMLIFIIPFYTISYMFPMSIFIYNYLFKSDALYNDILWYFCFNVKIISIILIINWKFIQINIRERTK